MVDSGLSAEEKLMEFHSLLINQRKTIIYLSKLNEELSQSVRLMILGMVIRIGNFK